MRRRLAAVTALALVGASTGIGGADQVTTYQSTEESSVTTSSTPAVSQSSSTMAPSAATPATTPNETAQAAPAGQTAGGDVVGAVQSVDRQARSLVLQDSSGQSVTVNLADNVRFYRHGQQVDYRDIEPNDIIKVHYRS